MDIYQQFIHKSRYARWLDKEKRRETWQETVSRYVSYMRKKFGSKIPSQFFEEMEGSITSLNSMPSMRALMTAGKAADRDGTCFYNCAYTTVDTWRAFDEILFILMCGTGVGFSVEKELVDKLHALPSTFVEKGNIVVSDSKRGWAVAYRKLISNLRRGRVPTWDMSRIRPAGARLKTFGGRASGPEPLIQLFNFTIKTFKGAAGRKLTPLECHDVICSIAEIVVCGGVRRSALISLSSLDDNEMAEAKAFKPEAEKQWYETDKQRGLANNSAVYNERPARELFDREWNILVNSGSGERGIVNRSAFKRSCEKYGRRKNVMWIGVNPCSEILLRPNQFCNLTEVPIREDDTVETLKPKIKQAVIMGTLQSCVTNFNYLRPIWKKNCEEERLLGVSLTGICDNEFFSTPSKELDEALRSLAAYTLEVNTEIAKMLGINQSVAITTVKPSGTVSQLVNSSSGIHPRHAPYYIRRVRCDAKDPLAQYLADAGVPCEWCVVKPGQTYVFSWPQKAPAHAVIRNQRSAIQQLELYRTYKENWTEHTVSITVYVKDHEWKDVGDWVYDHWDVIGGISFFPYSESDTVYAQAPYEECTKEQYEKLLAQIPEIDWTRMSIYESEDKTTGSQELACVGGVCSTLDVGSEEQK